MSDPSLDDQMEAVWRRHLRDTRRRVVRVRAAIRALEVGDPSLRDAARADAHQLVGVAATFGRTELAELAGAAERLLRPGDLDDAEFTELGDVARRLDALHVR